MRRADFPLLQKKITYLDSAATSQKPAVVIKAVTDFYETMNANVHRGLYALSQKSTVAYENARQVVARFLNAEFEEVVFTKGTTEGLNLLATVLGLHGEDEVVLTEMEHHANLIPWQQCKAKLRFIPLTKDYRLDLVAARKLITPKTKVVSVMHVSNVLGTVNDVKLIGQMAHDVKAVMIVDAAQSVAHFKVDVKDLGCDFLVFSGHKVFGPTGIGVLYGRKELLQRLPPYQCGGEMIEDVTYETVTWRGLPYKFEAGTPPIAGAIGLAKALEYVQMLKGREEHDCELVRYGLAELKKISGLTIIGPNDTKERVPLFSFTLEGIHPHDVAEILDKYHIAVRAGNHCAMPLMKKLHLTGTTRASFSIYNSVEDVGTLVQGLKKVQEVFQ